MGKNNNDAAKKERAEQLLQYTADLKHLLSSPTEAFITFLTSNIMPEIRVKHLKAIPDMGLAMGVRPKNRKDYTQHRPQDAQCIAQKYTLPNSTSFDYHHWVRVRMWNIYHDTIKQKRYVCIIVGGARVLLVGESLYKSSFGIPADADINVKQEA